MDSNVRDSSIGANKASDNATLNNSITNSYSYSYSFNISMSDRQERLLEEYSMLSRRDDRRVTPGEEPYLRSLAAGFQPPQTTNGASDVKLASDRRRQSIEAVPDAPCPDDTECSPKPYTYKDDIKNCSNRFPDPTDTPAVTQSLSKRHLGVLDQWIAAKSSQMLSIVAVEEENDRLPWTTNLVLEVIGRIGKTTENSGQPRQPNAILAHSCESKEAKPRRQEVVLVQHLLRQLRGALDARPGKTLVGSKSQPTSEDPEKLWDMLKKGILEFEIGTLVILLDNVERLMPTENFRCFASNLNSLFESFRGNNKILVKVLVTSRLMATQSHFEKPGSRAITLPQPPS